MTNSLRELKGRLTQLRKEHERIGALVEHYTFVIDDLESLAGQEELPQTTSNMRDVMEQILRNSGEPLHYRAIYDRLAKMGIQVRGEDPVRNTGAHLSSDERFRSLGDGMWALADWVGVPSRAPSVRHRNH